MKSAAVEQQPELEALLCSSRFSAPPEVGGGGETLWDFLLPVDLAFEHDYSHYKDYFLTQGERASFISIALGSWKSLKFEWWMLVQATEHIHCFGSWVLNAC